jgi:hypothetical protein
MLGERHYLCNQENSVKYTEVSKYRREVCINFRLKDILGILSRKFRNSRPERKFNDGLSLDKSNQLPVRYLNNEVAKHTGMKEKKYELHHKILLLLYFSNRNE